MNKGKISKQINEALNKYNPESLGNDFYKFRPYSIFEFSNINVEDLFMTYICEEFCFCTIEYSIYFNQVADNGHSDYFRLMTFNDLFKSAYSVREIKVYHSNPSNVIDIVFDDKGLNDRRNLH